ncbi:MBL fold metallo-hydrolase [Brenneria populi]|uniref:MBL fold metallo-hydrolase n=1 Tax=Brenneria populi TaxID=1505588 RepID=A0ABU6JR42_9GAMM|nr:MBL fold metallo-hydrolase [Brenneria populi Li et al. 2015]
MGHKFRLDVIGCGDAYDGRHANASITIGENGYRLLIDCGPTVPAALFNAGLDPESLDAIYLTHAHPDHCLGLTTLLNWMDARRRKRPLTLIAQRAQWAVIEPLIRFAHWPAPAPGFVISRQDTESTSAIGPWTIRTSPTRHAVANLSLHITTCGGHQLFYSGDGLLSPEGKALASQSDWVFLECEMLARHPSHGSWQDIALLPRKPGSRWRLYHIAPELRAALRDNISTVGGLSLAEDGETLDVAAEETVGDFEQE